MEKQKRVARQVFERNADNVPRARELCMSVSDPSFGLQAPFSQPLAGESEARATMVILAIIDTNRTAILKNGAIFRHAVRNAGEEFRQMERSVIVVIDPEEKDLPVQSVHTTDGTVGGMGRNGKGTGGDLRRIGAGRRESKRVVAAHDPG